MGQLLGVSLDRARQIGDGGRVGLPRVGEIAGEHLDCCRAAADETAVWPRLDEQRCRGRFFPAAGTDQGWDERDWCFRFLADLGAIELGSAS